MAHILQNLNLGVLWAPLRALQSLIPLLQHFPLLVLVEVAGVESSRGDILFHLKILRLTVHRLYFDFGYPIYACMLEYPSLLLSLPHDL